MIPITTNMNSFSKKLNRLPENLYKAAANINELKKMKVSLGSKRLTFLFSKGTNAKLNCKYKIIYLS